MHADVHTMDTTTRYTEIEGADGSVLIVADTSEFVLIEHVDGRISTLECTVEEFLEQVRHTLRGAIGAVENDGVTIDSDEDGYVLHVEVDDITHTWLIGSHDALDDVQSGHGDSIPDADREQARAMYAAYAPIGRARYIDEMIDAGRMTLASAQADAERLQLI